MSVVIETTIGDITVDLFTKERPRTCLNFLKLCKSKYYNFNTIFSVQRNFIAQMGDPTGTGQGGDSLFSQLYGDQARFFEGEKNPIMKHHDIGTVSMVNCGDNHIFGSQFFITLGQDLDSLDNVHLVFGKVVEGLDIVLKLNEIITSQENRPYKSIFITHTVILNDPFPDPDKLKLSNQSPEIPRDIIDDLYTAVMSDDDENDGLSAHEIAEQLASKDAEARAVVLEMVGDLPDADMAPPENILFVCKLNPVTTSEDLMIIFSRFGKINSCEVITDQKTNNSLQYAFIEFAETKSCEDAYFKMDNVLIDERRIHVDFSQSVSKIKWRGKGRIEYYDDSGKRTNDNTSPSYFDAKKGNSHSDAHKRQSPQVRNYRNNRSNSRSRSRSSAKRKKRTRSPSSYGEKRSHSDRRHISRHNHKRSRQSDSPADGYRNRRHPTSHNRRTLRSSSTDRKKNRIDSKNESVGGNRKRKCSRSISKERSIRRQRSRSSSIERNKRNLSRSCSNSRESQRMATKNRPKARRTRSRSVSLVRKTNRSRRYHDGVKGRSSSVSSDGERKRCSGEKDSKKYPNRRTRSRSISPDMRKRKMTSRSASRERRRWRKSPSRDSKKITVRSRSRSYDRRSRPRNLSADRRKESIDSRVGNRSTHKSQRRERNISPSRKRSLSADERKETRRRSPGRNISGASRRPTIPSADRKSKKHRSPSNNSEDSSDSSDEELSKVRKKKYDKKLLKLLKKDLKKKKSKSRKKSKKKSKKKKRQSSSSDDSSSS